MKGAAERKVGEEDEQATPSAKTPPADSAADMTELNASVSAAKKAECSCLVS